MFVVNAARPITLDRFVAVSTDAAVSAALAAAEAEACGFDQCFAEHKAAMNAFWARADIEIDGSLYDRKATRFCVFQIGAASPDSDTWSYGAKLLAGPHYHGVVFWDVDLFILPYLTRVFAERARRHLEFRYSGLDCAREKARRHGFRGAMYPWNAGPSGDEASLGPTGEMEVHIVTDVAWGVVDHVNWTGDHAFMAAKGREILVECARFWVSRMDAEGSIRGVIGPDEYAQNVTNIRSTALARAFGLVANRRAALVT